MLFTKRHHFNRTRFLLPSLFSSAISNKHAQTSLSFFFFLRLIYSALVRTVGETVLLAVLDFFKYLHLLVAIDIALKDFCMDCN